MWIWQHFYALLYISCIEYDDLLSLVHQCVWHCGFSWRWELEWDKCTENKRRTLGMGPVDLCFLWIPNPIEMCPVVKCSCCVLVYVFWLPQSIRLLAFIAAGFLLCGKRSFLTDLLKTTCINTSSFWIYLHLGSSSMGIVTSIISSIVRHYHYSSYFIIMFNVVGIII